MAEPLRHRQTKGAETDMPSLPPPRHIPTLPNSRCASTIDKYRDLRVREHFDRLTAEDNRRHTATPVRGHHDQIAPSRPGGFDDCLLYVFMLGMERLAANTG